jgi:hypothetical protein
MGLPARSGRPGRRRKRILEGLGGEPPPYRKSAPRGRRPRSCRREPHRVAPATLRIDLTYIFGWRVRCRMTVGSGSDHHQIDAAIFEASSRKTFPRHLFDPAPVLTEIARSLMLGRKFSLQAAGMARISVCDLEQHCLLPLFHVGLCPRPIAHRMFLCESRHSQMLGSTNPAPLLRRYCVGRISRPTQTPHPRSRSRWRWKAQSFSVRLLLWPGAAVDGGVRNASKRSFTIA